MIKLNYSNYIVSKDFDIEKAYLNDLKTITKFEKPNEDIEIRFNRYKINNNSFKEVFKNYNLENIIFAKENEFYLLIETIEKRINTLTKKKKEEFIDLVQNLFKYSNKFQRKVLTPFFTKNFTFRTCFYCNKDFITNFEKEKQNLVSTFQLDHFYDKDTYPYLALSFYNLIPSCPICNSSKVKGTKNTFIHDARIGKFKTEKCLKPNDIDFDFNEKVKFKLYLDESCKNLHIKSKDDIEVSLKEQFTDKYDKYMEVFKLNERYKAHKDIVYEMIEKAELYPESRLKELQNLTGIPFQQIKKDIFNLIDENEDLSKKPFSKLIKDISKELGLE